MTAPRWSQHLLRWLAPASRRDEVLGDLEEMHRRDPNNERAAGDLLRGSRQAPVLFFEARRHRGRHIHDQPAAAHEAPGRHRFSAGLRAPKRPCRYRSLDPGRLTR